MEGQEAAQLTVTGISNKLYSSVRAVRTNQVIIFALKIHEMMNNMNSRLYVVD